MDNFNSPKNTLDAAPLPTLNSPPEIPLQGAVFYPDQFYAETPVEYPPATDVASDQE
jgi:hypothetical protein